MPKSLQPPVDPATSSEQPPVDPATSSDGAPTSAPGTELHHFSADCPTRLLFDQIADKWSMMVLCILDDGPRRFNDIKRRLEGVTQKSLTHALRQLERNGLVARAVLATSPVGVQYSLSALGRSLLVPYRRLNGWMLEHFEEVERARNHYDANSR